MYIHTFHHFNQNCVDKMTRGLQVSIGFNPQFFHCTNWYEFWNCLKYSNFTASTSSIWISPWWMWIIPVPAWIFWHPDTSIEKACPCPPVVMKPKRVSGKIWSKNKFWSLSCVQFTLSLLLYGDKQSACHAYSTGNKEISTIIWPFSGLYDLLTSTNSFC